MGILSKLVNKQVSSPFFQHPFSFHILLFGCMKAGLHKQELIVNMIVSLPVYDISCLYLFAVGCIKNYETVIEFKIGRKEETWQSKLVYLNVTFSAIVLDRLIFRRSMENGPLAIW